eukprot:CAMPEP_0172444298 /NCGR_PEP_ID=MMETSP1065-20121228/4354_1 /TAXON_ID=265537 /ORGANISM="Amphiprora paludosa, Strain CCMP125" /LENGTH=807 /DNA_ID=CAMNT_0013194775 /DNA_START=59 /DNA_END=2482 /DNA_ORIENTATION=-
MVAEQRSPKESGIEVDLRWYVTGLSVIMACSFMAGLQSPLVHHIESSLSENTEESYHSDSSAMPPSADRSKIVRDAFLVSEEDVAKAGAPDIATIKFDPTAAAAGEHLLVDIEGIEADFLDSESRLAQAMVTTTKEAGLEMLSYHCHSLEPKGVSCVGVLLESHMSFHTWPDEGVITLDLYVTTVSTNKEQQAKQKALVPDVVDIIKQQFGVTNPDQPAPRPLNTRWSHEFRGFDPSAAQENDGIHLAGSDLALWILSPLEMHTKNLIYSGWTQSNQRVDIWDMVEVTDTPSKQDIIKYGLTEGDPRLLTPELATPARVAFLNGHVLSDMDSESILSESIAQPAMFAHKGPEQVTILAGPVGLGSGVIREVLKHQTITGVTAWHTNAELVEEIVPKHLGIMDDCTVLKGRADQCSKDPLVSLKYYEEQPFSSIITPENLSTPQDVIFVLDFESILKTTDKVSETLSVLMDGLTDEGVLLFPVGTAAAIHDPRADLGVHAKREELFKSLEGLDSVAAMLVYEEAHTGNLEPEGFLLVCKDASCRQRWYARSDQVEYQIYERLVRTQPKEPDQEKPLVLSYFDGTTQRSYQWPKKGWETVYCRREPTPWECAYTHLNQHAEFHELDLEDESESSFRVETTMSEDGKELEESRVFATTDIPKGSYIMAEHLASSLMLTERNLEGLNNNTKLATAGVEESEDGESKGPARATIIEDLLDFFDHHGHPSIMEGSEQHYVEVGGTALIRRTDNVKESNLEPWVPRRRSPKPTYSPVYERHRMSFDVFIVASRDIEEGEEIVMHEDMWTAPSVE